MLIELGLLIGGGYLLAGSMKRNKDKTSLSLSDRIEKKAFRTSSQSLYCLIDLSQNYLQSLSPDIFDFTLMPHQVLHHFSKPKSIICNPAEL